MYYCPNYGQIDPRQNPFEAGPTRAYCYNDWLADADLYLRPGTLAFKISRVKKATDVPMLYDGRYYYPFFLFYGYYDITENHKSGANIAFVDGHVDAHKGLRDIGGGYSYVGAPDGVQMRPYD
jgi:prepilin-type processing-associated H-X9-DG protein